MVIPAGFTEVDGVDVAFLGAVVGETVDVDVSVAVSKHCNK